MDDIALAPIRVLHVTGGLEPGLGGPAVGILNYVSATAGPGVELHLLAAIDDPDSPLATELRARMHVAGSGITLVRRTWRFRGRASRWGISIPLARWLARHAKEFDVIVVHGAWMFSSVAALVMGRLAGKAFVLVPHESLTEFDVKRKGSIARIAAKTALKRIYGRYCNLILFTSRAEADDTLPVGSKPGSVIHYPLFDDRVAASERRRHAREASLRVGFLGRIHPKKNIDVLLRAIARLPKSFELRIGGDGPAALKSNLQSLAAELGIHERVSWTGFVSALEKDEFFASIDVLVMPSEFESFGIVAAEAMMHGVPAIVSPDTGAAELIRSHGGGLVVPATPDAIADALSRLDSDAKMMDRLSVEAIAAATAELSFSHIGARLREQYRDLVREVSPASARTPSR
jgi:glycosyltransferase involved in cell wall biosynthesis